MNDIQYFINVEKGFTVSYGNSHYRVQDDGRGWLHIVVIENNKRRKIGIDELKRRFAFKPGTEADWIFNGWSVFYDYQLYMSFALAEVAWIEN